MSAEDTEISAEVIVDAIIRRALKAHHQNLSQLAQVLTCTNWCC